MALFRVLIPVLAIFSLAGSASADWQYVCRSKKTDPTGTLTTKVHNGQTVVSIKQFCFAFGCRAFYEWSKHKAVVQNPEDHVGAVLSSITHVALVDGKVVDFDGEVISDLREGYLIPIDLATKLASLLQMGRIEQHDTPVVKPVTQERAELKTIVIDPGHGGNDLGTEFGTIFEKDVSVIYAMKLRDELNQQMPDVKVLLTRDSDKYVSLPDRAKFANAANANLFVSLHVNHAPNAKVEGTETYILNPQATDDDARKVALLENDTWLKSSGINSSGDVVQKILVDMEQTKYIQKSALAASLIQQELAPLDKTQGLKGRGVKQAMFYVLSQVAMPSTLVEMAFLSNTGDRGRLMSMAFRDEFVKSIVNAIKRYRTELSGSPKEVTK